MSRLIFIWSLMFLLNGTVGGIPCAILHTILALTQALVISIIVYWVLSFTSKLSKVQLRKHFVDRQMGDTQTNFMNETQEQKTEYRNFIFEVLKMSKELQAKTIGIYTCCTFVLCFGVSFLDIFAVANNFNNNRDLCITRQVVWPFLVWLWFMVWYWKRVSKFKNVDPYLNIYRLQVKTIAGGISLIPSALVFLFGVSQSCVTCVTILQYSSLR